MKLTTPSHSSPYKNPKPRMWWGRGGNWKELCQQLTQRTLIITKFLCLLHITENYLISPTIVHGPSMLPTLNVRGDVLLAEKVTHRFGGVRLGDVVLVKSLQNPNRVLTKRVLGLEGDVVSFTSTSGSWHSSTFTSFVVPKGHVWIQGDNLYASNDSRHFGPVPYGLIQGKVLCRVWPLNGFGPLGP